MARNYWEKLRDVQAKSSEKRGRRLLAEAQTPKRRLVGPLTPGQKKFALELARRTNLSPRVIAAWALAEMSGPHAQKREAERNFNALNIGYFDSGPQPLTQDGVWSDPKSAAKATARFLKGKQYGASPGIQAILDAAGKSEEEQIAAIARSGWSSDSYGGGSALRGTLGQVKLKGGRSKLDRRLARRKLNKQARRYIKPTEDIETIADQLGVPVEEAGLWRDELDPVLKRRLVKLAKLSGQPVMVNEGKRTRYRQEQLASGKGGATGPAAAPGTSNHEFGKAVDAQLTPEQRELLGEAGLHLPVPGEDWHVEAIDSGSGTAAIPGGSGGGGYLGGGGGGAGSGSGGGGAGGGAALMPTSSPLSGLAQQLIQASIAAGLIGREEDEEDEEKGRRRRRTVRR